MNLYVLDLTVLGNTVGRYCIAAAAGIAGIALVKVFQVILLRRLRKWAAKNQRIIDPRLVRGFEKAIIPFLYAASLYYSAVSFLTMSERVARWAFTAFIALSTILAVRLASSLIRLAVERYWERKYPDEAEGERRSIRGVSSLINLLVWSVGAIFLLDNLGFRISAVVAGLGIGGIAVALAGQTILGDLFNYFVILFDQPFQVGDFIVVDGKMGIVDRIGIKTTRIHSLSGEQIVLSNTDLTGSRIHNYRKMEKRRVEFSFGVLYRTPPEVLERIPGVIREIIEAIPVAEFDRAHFHAFGDSSLDFRVVYFVGSPEYTVYMDTQQTINLALMRSFRDMGVDFAYPTRTIYMEK
ncbi:MAG: mechanosensitive ion channel family protein [Spirochaetes bacterium]|nr:mechanosensitive ion channel family protein [Spirochaetota bacterium]